VDPMERPVACEWEGARERWGPRNDFPLRCGLTWAECTVYGDAYLKETLKGYVHHRVVTLFGVHAKSCFIGITKHHKTPFYRPHETHTPSQKASVMFII
jgi:hypothetical protein